MFGMSKDDGSAASAQAMGQMMDDPALLDSAASMMGSTQPTDPALSGTSTNDQPAPSAPTSTDPFTSSQPTPPVVNDITPPTASNDSPYSSPPTTDPAPASDPVSTPAQLDNPAPAWTPAPSDKPDEKPAENTSEDNSTDDDKFSYGVTPTTSSTVDDKPVEETKEPEVPAPTSSFSMASTLDEKPKSDDKPVATGDLANIKEQALKQLQPLVTKLEQSPEEEFRTLMMMIQASDDHSLIDKAYKAAQNIADEKAKAQALLDIVNEVNYFTQK